MPRAHLSINILCSSILLASASICMTAMAAVPADYAVGVTVTTVSAPPSITLAWPAFAGATGYSLYRREYNATSTWGSSIATLAAGATSFTDASVVVGHRYEYQVSRAGTPYGYGYQLAGIDMPAVDDRGTVVLVVDDSMSAPLASELQRLHDDLVGDGWTVVRFDVSRSAPVTSVKALIRPECLADPLRTQVFLFGHVPVPYSGLINPDGHPDHYGAWPADGYYADLDGAYTDTSADNTSSNPSPARPENRNIPGDGKFDQSALTGTSFVGLGRVDLSNMPSFGLSETELLRRYLGKDHAFRTKAVTAQARGLIDDNFGDFGGEAFAQSGWRNFGELVGPANVASLDWFTTLPTNDYLLAYGCGGGWFQGAGGVGQTSDFAGTSSKAVFTMLFGSYFGDWDVSDNFLRAPLAGAGMGLTCFWAGRPNWIMHPMGLGEPIGSSARLQMVSPYGYPPSGYGAGQVHVALMGDPTLRLHVAQPPSVVSSSVDGAVVHLSWTTSSDATLGYLVFRSPAANGPFVRVTATPVSGTSFDDTPGTGAWYYLIKAVHREVSTSGSYIDTSVGSAASVTVVPADGGSQQTKCGVGSIGFVLAYLGLRVLRRRRG